MLLFFLCFQRCSPLTLFSASMARLRISDIHMEGREFEHWVVPVFVVEITSVSISSRCIPGYMQKNWLVPVMTPSDTVWIRGRHNNCYYVIPATLLELGLIQHTSARVDTRGVLPVKYRMRKFISFGWIKTMKKKNSSQNFVSLFKTSKAGAI